MDCIFCKIIKKEAPASLVYEDERILGFMGIRPAHTGECILIPKEHIDHFMDVPDELAERIMGIAQKLARNIRREFQPQRVGYVVAGYGVPHAHLIVIPQNHTNDITSQHFARIEDGEIKWSDVHLERPREELDEIASKIKL